MDVGKGLSITYTQILWNLAYGTGLSLGSIRRSELRTDVQGLELAERRDYQAQPQVAMATNSHLPFRGGRVRERTERAIGLVLQRSGLGVREDLTEVRASMPNLVSSKLALSSEAQSTLVRISPPRTASIKAMIRGQGGAFLGKRY